jgi:hypothetical protein
MPLTRYFLSNEVAFHFVYVWRMLTLVWMVNRYIMEVSFEIEISVVLALLCLNSVLLNHA